MEPRRTLITKAMQTVARNNNVNTAPGSNQLTKSQVTQRILRVFVSVVSVKNGRFGPASREKAFLRSATFGKVGSQQTSEAAQHL